MKENLVSKFEPRQYLLARDYELFYYKDRDFPDIPGHSHDFYEFYLLMSGDVSMSVNGSVCGAGKGKMIAIPPGTEHHLLNHTPEEPYERYVFWVSRPFYDRMASGSADYDYAMRFAEKEKRYSLQCDLSGTRELQSCMTSLLEEQKSERFGREEACRILAEKLLLSFNRIFYETHHPGKESLSEGGLTSRVLEYVNANLSAALSYDDLSREFFVSKYHLAHIFKEELGTSLHRYILDKRLEYAVSALKTERIQTVFSQSGFRDYSSFYKAFRTRYGKTPREYRKELRSAK